MNETLFYVLGIGLVVVAVLVAAIGLRFEVPGFQGVLVLGTAAFAALVVATGAFAWLNAEDEQEHHEAELAEAAEETAAEDEGARRPRRSARTWPRLRPRPPPPRAQSSSRPTVAAAVTRLPRRARPGRRAPTSTAR